MPRTVGIVGAGLMGTSVALALRTAGVSVLLTDRDPSRVTLAGELGAGEPWADRVRTDLTVLAIPPSAVAAELVALQRADRSATYTDLSSVQVGPAAQARALGCAMAAFCGGHPIAGRERAGPSAARADLFEGQLWVLVPQPDTAEPARAAADWVARACGARPVVMSPEQHDEALGLTSHVPQLVASLLAARLVDVPEETALLAGQGLRDTTRIAGSDSRLWADVVASNATPVRRVLAQLAADLDELRRGLDDADPVGRMRAVAELVGRGNEGRRRLPGKHGIPAAYVSLPVVVQDVPGRLAQLLTDVARAGVNVEDLVIEHAPGRPLGVAEIVVRPADADRLAAALRSAGWSVHWR